MNKTDRTSHSIDDENGAAIRNVNSQSNAALVCDQPIHAIKAPAFVKRLRNDGNPVPVHLFRRRESHLAQPETLTKSAVKLIEPGQRLRAISHNVDSRNSADEPVPDRSERLQRGEKLQG